MQPYTFYQLLEGYQWRKDQETLFYGHFFLPITNYVMDKDHRFKDLGAFVGHMLSDECRHELEKAREKEKQKNEEYLKKKFNL